MLSNALLYNGEGRFKRLDIQQRFLFDKSHLKVHAFIFFPFLPDDAV